MLALWPRSPSARPPVAFVAWTHRPGRAEEVAAALGGEARAFYFAGIGDKRLIPLRYAADALRTLAYLVRRRPRSVVATHPPIFAALVCLAWARLAGIPLVLDSHPSAFGLAGDALSRKLLPVHRWLARRAVATLVTGPALGGLVASWGGRPEVLHEAEPTWRSTPARPAPARPAVLFAGTFAADEPVAEVLAAARAVPDVEVRITGDLARRPAELEGIEPANVRWLGYLPRDAYLAALRDADAVLALSTEDTSVMRTACEAVWAERPLAVSDWPYLRETFPDAVHVGNDRDGIAGGLRLLAGRHAELVRAAPAARARQAARWRAQRDRLAAALGLPGPYGRE